MNERYINIANRLGCFNEQEGLLSTSRQFLSFKEFALDDV